MPKRKREMDTETRVILREARERRRSKTGKTKAEESAETTRARAQAACDAWNAANEVGCEVVVRRDSGERKETITRGAAFVSESGDAVIMVVGISGYCLLERVTAVPMPTKLERPRPPTAADMVDEPSVSAMPIRAPEPSTGPIVGKAADRVIVDDRW